MEDLVIEEEGASSALKITLGDFLVFINWMNQTEKALERGEALPTTPELDSGKVKGWIQLVQRLEERFRRSEEKKIALEASAHFSAWKTERTGRDSPVNIHCNLCFFVSH